MNDEGTRLTTHEELAEEIVSSAVVKFSKRFPDIKVEVDIPEEVVIVPMDPILIRQVIVNIMENGCDTWRNDDAGEGNHICE